MLENVGILVHGTTANKDIEKTVNMSWSTASDEPNSGKVWGDGAITKFKVINQIITDEPLHNYYIALRLRHPQ